MPGFDWRKYDFVECDECKTLNVVPNTVVAKDEIHPLCNCKQCQSDLDSKRIKTFIIPEFGFVAEEKIEKPGLIKPEKTYRTEASFFNNTDHITENNYQIGDADVSIAIVGNDGEMAMLNTTDFFVCPSCGYTIESPAGKNPFAKKHNEKNNHKDPKGYVCKNQELEKYSLGYKFKTDVIRIRINHPLLQGVKKYEEAYSILQALILASCKELNIETNEIAGCLQYYYQNGENYSYILYDTTPGGAGHVKRLNNKNTILHVLINAMNLAQKCPKCAEDSSCYSCLRTYQNQRKHDIIKREYVFKYLGQILSGYSDEDADSKLEEIFLAKLQNYADSWKVTGTEKNVYIAIFGDQKWSIEPQVYLDPTKNVISPSKPDFLMTPYDENQKKIAIFTDGFKFHNDIVDKDSIKRNAILYSGNYRVCSLSWNDVKETSDKVFATDVFNQSNLPSKLTGSKFELSYSNTFKLLLEYLRNPSAEEDFKNLAYSYFDAMNGKNVSSSDVKYELDQINNQVELLDESNNYNLDKYSLADSQFSVYLINCGSKKVVTYIQDYISKRKEKFAYDWNAYIQVNNIMQFVDEFISTTQQGLDNEIYSILSKVEKTDSNISEEWNNILNQVVDSDAKSFIKECINNGVVVPTTVGFELKDGSIAELEWDDLGIVYLTKEQLEFKDSFEDEGYDVVTSFDELSNVIKE